MDPSETASDKSKVELEARYADLEIKCQQYQERCESLEGELEETRAKQAENATSLNSQLQIAQTSINQLTEAVGLVSKENGLKMQLATFDKAEVILKLAASEKRNLALSIQLQVASKEVEMVAKVDERKSRLIELLDAKVNSLAEKTKSVTLKNELLVAEHVRDVEAIKDRNKHVKELQTQLDATTRAYENAKSAAKEFKEMLNSIQDKGREIARIAKEKVYFYRDENTSLKTNAEGLLRTIREQDEILAKGSDERWSHVQQSLRERSEENTKLKVDLANVTQLLEGLQKKCDLEEQQKKSHLEELLQKSQLEEAQRKCEIEELQKKYNLEELQKKCDLEELQQKSETEGLQKQSDTGAN